jgi:hypothetical protein
MDQSAEVKLHELRLKTNRELVSLISNKLDRGLAFARALEAESDSNWSSTEHFAVNAEKALADATAWMGLLSGATQLERRRLEFKLAQLRTALEGTRESNVRVQAAC